MRDSDEGSRSRTGTVASIADSLQRVDILFNSKRQDLVKRLREGSKAWDRRRAELVESPGQVSLSRPSKRPKGQQAALRFLRDSEFDQASHAAMPSLLRKPDGSSLQV